MVELCKIMPDYFVVMPDLMPDLKEHIDCCLLDIFVTTYGPQLSLLASGDKKHGSYSARDLKF